jgi:hypothetical protein
LLIDSSTKTLQPCSGSVIFKSSTLSPLRVWLQVTRPQILLRVPLVN